MCTDCGYGILVCIEYEIRAIQHFDTTLINKAERLEQNMFAFSNSTYSIVCTLLQYHRYHHNQGMDAEYIYTYI